jgi:hypothetical protein
VYIDNTDDPAEMWQILEESLDTASTSVGRQQIHQRFMNLKPTPGAPISNFFSELRQLQNQIRGTEEEISDTAFKMHIFSSLPPVFEVTAKIQQNNPLATVQSIMDALLEDETCPMQQLKRLLAMLPARLN